MVVRSYTVRKRNSVCAGLMLVMALSGNLQAGIFDSAWNTVAEVLPHDASIDLPSFDLPKPDTFKRFLALSGTMGLLSGTPKKWLPKVVSRFLSQFDSEENVHAMSEIFAGSMAASVADGNLHTNKLRSTVAATVLAVTARWIDSVLRLTPWTKDWACANAKCKGLCDDCKMHKANFALAARGWGSNLLHSVK